MTDAPTLSDPVSLDPDVLVAIRDLKVRFPVKGGIFLRTQAEIPAVDGVSLDICDGETLGLVGESGSGKTTLGKAVMNVLKVSAPDVDVQGHIFLRDGDESVDLLGLSRRGLLPYRKHIQMVFQDPYSSLNPRLVVNDIVREPLDIHHSEATDREKSEMTANLLERVGLSPEQGGRYPHEFSGGQRQRIGIARSLATMPRLVIADEPVSALDVSIQAQVINLLHDLKEEYGLTLLFIAHDLAVVEHISERIAVMYLGDLVEIGPAAAVYSSPVHPYTRSLIAAIPRLDPRNRNRERIRLKGEIPSPLQKPTGCGFRLRCPLATPECAEEKPGMRSFGPDHVAACINV